MGVNDVALSWHELGLTDLIVLNQISQSVNIFNGS